MILLAELSELADERDLGSRVLWRVGSSPTFRIDEHEIFRAVLKGMLLTALQGVNSNNEIE